MPEKDPHHPSSHEIALPHGVSLADRFWIEPDTLGSVKDIINSSRLATMSLGVESRRDETPEIAENLRDTLVDPDSPLASEFNRALEVGYLYGALLTRDEDTKPEDAQLPDGFMAALNEVTLGLDLSTVNDNYLLFMRMRELEVEFAGSDVLAFSLAATQDHMGVLFRLHHKGEDALTKRDVTQMQTLYYAGALAGALANTRQVLPTVGVQIMRGMNDPVETVSIRQEFGPDDSIEKSIEYFLRSKYSFHTITKNGDFGLAVVPGSLQFGPNISSMPIFIPDIMEGAATCQVPARDIDALIIESGWQEGTDHTTVRIEKDVKEYLETHQNIELGDEQIKGLVSGDVCLSSYDVAHPWALEIDGLIQRELGIKPGGVMYGNELQLWEERAHKPGIKRMHRLVFAAAMAGVWVPDAINKALLPDHEVNWENGLVSSGVVLAVAGLMTYARCRIEGTADDRIARFDRIWQEHLDQQTLGES